MKLIMCEYCGCEVSYRGKGRPPRYCSASHRQLAHQLRQQVRAAEAAVRSHEHDLRLAQEAAKEHSKMTNINDLVKETQRNLPPIDTTTLLEGIAPVLENSHVLKAVQDIDLGITDHVIKAVQDIDLGITDRVIKAVQDIDLGITDHVINDLRTILPPIDTPPS